MNQKVSTLMQPVFSDDPQRPMVIRTVTPIGRANMQVEGGSTTQREQVSEYVLLSVLPQDLRERVVTAIKALAQA